MVVTTKEVTAQTKLGRIANINTLAGVKTCLSAAMDALLHLLPVHLHIKQEVMTSV